MEHAKLPLARVVEAVAFIIIFFNSSVCLGKATDENAQKCDQSESGKDGTTTLSPPQGKICVATMPGFGSYKLFNGAKLVLPKSRSWGNIALVSRVIFIPENQDQSVKTIFFGPLKIVTPRGKIQFARRTLYGVSYLEIWAFNAKEQVVSVNRPTRPYFIKADSLIGFNESGRVAYTKKTGDDFVWSPEDDSEIISPSELTADAGRPETANDGGELVEDDFDKGCGCQGSNKGSLVLLLLLIPLFLGSLRRT